MVLLLAIVNEAIVPFWFMAPIPVLIYYLLKKMLSSPNEKTRRIVILGSSMSGKTTLWNQLKDCKVGYDYNPTPGQAIIDSFKVKYKDHEVKVLATKDIGGGDAWVKFYDELIKENGTFIYFLVDLTRLSEAKQEMRSRLQVISKCIMDKKLNNCGLKIIATHYDEYKKIKGNEDNSLLPDQARNEVLRSLTDKKIKNCIFDIDIKRIMVANLLDSFYINIIKREITQEG